ncbi:TonB-dependent receptor domain-containing protein [Methylomonas koyamae]|uniref:TonB-dependent receptor domain-containing protein n=2 Tax=Methylomonas koyamae TaxID=702114 RepID=UPI001C822789|nr:TonB-dependent receptor [Methylomonas koyamae]
MKDYSTSAEPQTLGPDAGVPKTVSRRRTLSACVAVAIAGASLLAATDAQAAPAKKAAKRNAGNSKAASDLELENQRLRQELAAAKARELELIRKGSAAAGAAGAVAAGGATATEPGAEAAEAELQLAEQEDDKAKDLGEVVVKARPRLQKLKDIPNSTSVRTGEELHKELAMDLGDILKRAGNVKWNYGNARTSSLSMRGVGQQAQTDAMDPSVGTIVDNVPYAYNPLSSFDHYDIDSIQVERGPQGTDGGKNVSLGRVNINTRRPTFNREATYSATYGQFNTYIGDAALGGAVIDNFLAWRGAFHVNKGEGATKNLYNTDQTWYNRDRVSGRIQFLLTPSETFSTLIRFDANPRGEEFNNGNNFYTPTPRISANGLPTNLNNDAGTRLARRWFREGKPEYSYQNNYLYGNGENAFNQDAQYALITASKGGSVEANWDAGIGKFTSITAYRDFEFQARNDGDSTPFDVQKNGGGAVPEFRQLSQEIKFTSNWGNLVDYVAGAYFNDRKMIKGNRVGFGRDAGAWLAGAGAYGRLDADSAGRQLMMDSLNELHTDNPYYIHNKTASAFVNAKWHITEPLTLETGVRFNIENRRQETDKFITNQGSGAALNPYSVNGINLGGFDTVTATGDLTASAGLDPVQVARADAVALKYFGVATYAGLTPAQRRQVGDAKGLRAGQMGLLWGREPGRSFKSTQPSYQVRPTYKFNEDYTGYLSWGYNEKAGLSQTVNSVAYLVEPEKTNSFEIGLKSTLFNRALTLNTDFFWTEINNYQQAVQVIDQYQTAALGQDTYTSITGNAKGVRAYGVEVDGSLVDTIPFTSVNFSGSYNEAFYTDFKNAGKAAEWNNLASPTFDLTGRTLPGAAKFTFSVSPEFRYPVEVLGSNQEFHTSFTTAFTSSYKSDVALSEYSVIPANTTTDLSIGIGRKDRAFDVSLVAKNIFNNQTPFAKTWNSWQPGIPQWFGVTLNGKF